MGKAPDTDHVLSQVAIAPDDQVAANRDDFDTARVAGNASHVVALCGAWVEQSACANLTQRIGWSAPPHCGE